MYDREFSQGKVRQYASSLSIRACSDETLSPIDHGMLYALSQFRGQQFNKFLHGYQQDKNTISSSAISETLPLTALFIRPVGDKCNLNCSYCYQSELRSGTVETSMGIDTLQQILGRCQIKR